MDKRLSPWFQAITLAVTISSVVLIMTAMFSKFCSAEYEPKINSFSHHEASSAVTVGFSVKDFTDFDILKDTFKISGVVWFIYDPEKTSAGDLKSFMFEHGEIIEKSEPHITIINNHKAILFFHIIASFTANLNYKYYPFDDHVINIGLINYDLSYKQIRFTSGSENLVIPEYLSTLGWSYKKKKILSGYSEVRLGADVDAELKNIYHPKIVFQLYFQNDSIRQALGVILPLMLIFLIDLFSLCIDNKKYKEGLISLDVANIIALFAYRFVIVSTSPSTGYFIFADYLFFLFLFISFITFLTNTLVESDYLRITKFISIGLQLLVVGFFMYSYFFIIIC